MIWGFTGTEATRESIKGNVGKGWGPLIDQLIDDLLALEWNGTVMQVKEKFGGLRFYIGQGNNDIWKRIAEAEAASYKICEMCGEPGQLVAKAWWHTACPAHYRPGDAEFLALPEEEREP